MVGRKNHIHIPTHSPNLWCNGDLPWVEYINNPSYLSCYLGVPNKNLQPKMAHHNKKNKQFWRPPIPTILKVTFLECSTWQTKTPQGVFGHVERRWKRQGAGLHCLSQTQGFSSTSDAWNVACSQGGLPGYAGSR